MEAKYYQVAARLFKVDRALLSHQNADENSRALELIRDNTLENAIRDIR